MELNLEHPYERGLDQVIERFFDEAHIRNKNEQLGARNLQVPFVRIRNMVHYSGDWIVYFRIFS